MPASRRLLHGGLVAVGTDRVQLETREQGQRALEVRAALADEQRARRVGGGHDGEGAIVGRERVGPGEARLDGARPRRARS